MSSCGAKAFGVVIGEQRGVAKGHFFVVAFVFFLVEKARLWRLSMGLGDMALCGRGYLRCRVLQFVCV